MPVTAYINVKVAVEVQHTDHVDMAQLLDGELLLLKNKKIHVRYINS